MKTFVGLFLALALFECVTAVAQDYFDRAKAAKEKCAKEFNVGEEAIKAFKEQKKLPETEDEKCMLHCFMNEMKVFSDDGRIIVSEMQANNKLKWKDEKVVATANEIVEICDKEVSPDGMNKCDYAVAIVKCALKNGMERNVPMPDLKPDRR